MLRVMVADDDADIRNLVTEYLNLESLEVVQAPDGKAALELWREMTPDLIVLDVMMPKLDGLEVCRRIRQQSTVPIIFLTARSDEVDQLLGFGFGADDYVTKPFSPRALVARIKAVLRRLSTANGAEVGDSSGNTTDSEDALNFGSLTINPEGFTASVDGVNLDLTVKEFQLLQYFTAHPDRVLTKRQLVTGAWSEEYLGDDSTLMVHLSRLRQKLGDETNNPRWIRTIRGVGYKFLGKEAKGIETT